MADLDIHAPIFKSDDFMVYGFKILECRRTTRHNWRECPFAHQGEVATRRDPRQYTYVGLICPHSKRASVCPRGDDCPFTHSLFEYWLHPTRFKTEMCSRGRNCKRPFCFFAHDDLEVRSVDYEALFSIWLTEKKTSKAQPSSQKSSIDWPFPVASNPSPPKSLTFGRSGHQEKGISPRTPSPTTAAPLRTKDPDPHAFLHQDGNRWEQIMERMQQLSFRPPSQFHCNGSSLATQRNVHSSQGFLMDVDKEVQWTQHVRSKYSCEFHGFDFQVPNEEIYYPNLYSNEDLSAFLPTHLLDFN